MRRAAGLAAGLAAAALLGSCARAPSSPPAEPRVRAADHDSFFLWAGVRPPPWLDRARSVYLLAGELRAGDRRHIVPLRAVPRARRPALWLVVRVERLDWHEDAYRDVLELAGRWRRAGNRVAGVQIDFDARTRGLAGYADFLSGLRRRLPRDLALSVTGLMDWNANGDPAALARLGGVVDEVVIQTYQGRHTIPGYAAYLRALARLDQPYRIALVEGGAWKEPPDLRRDPDFRGYVVFLLPR